MLTFKLIAPMLRPLPASNLLTLPLLAALAACPGPSATTETDSDAGSGTSGPATTSTGPDDLTTTGFKLLCQPGEERCADAATREVCKPSGLAWEQIACDSHQVCSEPSGENTASTCVGPCEVASKEPNSVGCEFVALRVRSNNGDDDVTEFFDALIVGNPDDKETAELQLYFAPNGTHQDDALGEPVLLAPGESHIFELTNDVISGYSTVRSGGVYRVKSDIPVIAYLHSPLKNSASNDSSMLLPLKTLRQDYVIASYPPFVSAKLPDDKNGRPSYFNVVALENDTTIEWTPRRDTAGNDVPVPKVLAGQTGSVTINKFDVLQVGASSITNLEYDTHDVSGTLVHADKPIWVLGATACAFVPFDSAGFCNHLQEQMLPIEYWGSKYVGAHAPLRASEPHIWRVYAGEAGVTIATDPQQPGTPFTLNERGAFKEISVANGSSFTFQGTGPFLPVQYLVGNEEAGDKGDPAMYQMIPIEQFLDRYVFVTGVDYDLNYAQIIRVKGSAPVSVNKTPVPDDSYYLINSVNGLQYEVADYLLAPGDEPKVYVAESDDKFGVIVVGYQSVGANSAYAYPGGMALKPLYIP